MLLLVDGHKVSTAFKITNMISCLLGRECSPVFHASQRTCSEHVLLQDEGG